MSLDKARKKRWDRPFEALARMTPEQRNNIRDTLKFDWDDATIEAFGYERAQLEAWEIINCHMRGIAARLHTIWEQVIPSEYISWRRALIRALDCLGSNYSADDCEEVLEAKFLRIFDEDGRYSPRDQTSIPGKSIAKLDARTKIASEFLSALAEGWDDICNTEDWPAITAMVPICRTLSRRTSLV